MPKLSYAGCPGPSPAISAQFTFKMCVAAGNRKKFNKNLYFGSSRLFKIIDVDTNMSLLLVIINSMSVPICNRFHATRDNCGKITTFRGQLFLTPACTGLLNLGSRDLDC